MTITRQLLVDAIGCKAEHAERFAEPLREACERFSIDNPARLAAFLAQIGHESGSLRYTSEVWGPTAAQQRYEGRKDLGNTQPGDGERFKGHGLIQTTGRSNHRELKPALLLAGYEDVPDFEQEPERLTEPRWAAASAGSYWHSRKLNELADHGEFELITRRINGGLNGQADRLTRWERAKKALSLNSPTENQAMVAPVVAAVAIPFVEAAAKAIANNFGKVADLFAGESPTAKRNVEAAKIVVDTVATAIGAKNEQEVVEAMNNPDPAVLLKAKEAIEANWYQIKGASEEAIAAARVFATQYSANKDLRIVVFNLTFLELLSVLLVIGTMAAGMLVLFKLDLSDELKGAIIMLMLIGGFTGVKEFWFGSSHGSKSKDHSESRST